MTVNDKIFIDAKKLARYGSSCKDYMGVRPVYCPECGSNDTFVSNSRKNDSSSTHSRVYGAVYRDSVVAELHKTIDKLKDKLGGE